MHNKHPFPWPISVSAALLGLTIGGVMFFHSFINGIYLIYFSFLLVAILAGFWWRDVIREGTYLSFHTKEVFLGAYFHSNIRNLFNFFFFTTKIGNNILPVKVYGFLLIILFSYIYSTFFDQSLIFETAMFSNIATKAAKRGAEKIGQNAPKVVSSTKLMPDSPNQNPSTSAQPYATMNVWEAEKTPNDPQASVNNPPVNKGGQIIQHSQFVRGTCEEEDCKEQNCGPLPTPTANTAPCGETVTNLEAVGHATSGNPNINTGAVHTLDPLENFVGQKKPQNAVVYNTPHSTGVTPEAFPTPGKSTGKGTDFLHDPNNPHRVSKIIDETKNK